VLPKKSVVCDVQGYGCVLQECWKQMTTTEIV
jgi:hypothetical protein